MTPEAKQLLKDKPELCKEIAEAYAGWYINHLGDDSFETFLKEQTTPDWEILSFRSGGCFPFVLKENGKYGTGQDAKTGIIDIEHLLYGSTSVEDGILSIHSVRRSDGEVFEVGDRVSWLSSAYKGKIKGFKVEDSDLIVKLDSTPTLIGIKNLTKLKPLFKTEDGVDIYEEEEYCYFFGEMLHDAKAHITAPYQSDVKRFSTREAAEAWVEDHKPRYSIADLKARGLHI